MPWGERQVMEGVIDVIYRLDGKMWIADSKTDRTTISEAPARAQLYAHQPATHRGAGARAAAGPRGAGEGRVICPPGSNLSGSGDPMSGPVAGVLPISVSPSGRRRRPVSRRLTESITRFRTNIRTNRPAVIRHPQRRPRCASS